MGRGRGKGGGTNLDPGEPKGTGRSGSGRRHRDWGCPTLAWGTGRNRPLREPQDPQSYQRVQAWRKPALPLEASHDRKLEVTRDTMWALDIVNE